MGVLVILEPSSGLSELQPASATAAAKPATTNVFLEKFIAIPFLNNFIEFPLKFLFKANIKAKISRCYSTIDFNRI